MLLLLAAVIWGFAFVAQVLSVDTGLGPVSFNAIRFTLGAVALIPVILIFDRKGCGEVKTTLLASLISGALLFCAANLQQYALTINANPGFAGFITALYTVWTPIAYFVFFKKKTTANVWVALGIAIVGFYLLCMTDGGSISFGADVIILLISTFFWTAQILSVDHFVSKVSPLWLSCGQFFVCGILSFAYALVFERSALTFDSVMASKWSILYCGLLSVGVAYTLQVVGQRLTNPVVAVILMSTESVFSAVGGVLWNLIVPVALHITQDISPIGYIGCGVIFAGVVLSQIDIAEIIRNKRGREYETDI